MRNHSSTNHNFNNNNNSIQKKKRKHTIRKRKGKIRNCKNDWKSNNESNIRRSFNNDLYTNPTIRIQLPEKCQEITVNSVQLLDEDELKIASQKLVDGNILEIDKEDGQFAYKESEGKVKVYDFINIKDKKIPDTYKLEIDVYDIYKQGSEEISEAEINEETSDDANDETDNTEDEEFVEDTSEDNYEEVTQRVDAEQKTQLMAKVESTIYDWVNETNGILVKADRDTYVYVFEQKNLEKIKEEKSKWRNIIRCITRYNIHRKPNRRRVLCKREKNTSNQKNTRFWWRH